VLLALPLHHVAAMSFIWKVGEGVATSMREDWNRRCKLKEEMPRLNNFKKKKKNYACTFQNTKDYLFNCCTLTEANDWIDRKWFCVKTEIDVAN
jgi:hypothetical protein